MISIDEKERLISKIREMEDAVISVDKNNIGSFCLAVEKKSERLLNSNDVIAPVLRTALVINWKEEAMKKRYEIFREKFPEINSLKALRKKMDEKGPLEFCHEYLDINANPNKPQDNPKYRLLGTLVDGFLAYQNTIGAASEIEAMRSWAKKVDLSHVKRDPIGKYKGVGPGVIENIRLNLGYNVIKPDRHVIGVIEQFLNIVISPEKYDQLAAELDLSPKYLDCVLFNYGKLKNISA